MESLWTQCKNLEIWLKNGERLRTYPDSSKTHLDILSGKLQIFQIKIELECAGYSWSGICISLLFFGFWQRTRKKVWWINGDGLLVILTNSTVLLIVTEDSQLIELRTMFVTLTSIKWGGIRKWVWFTPTGGAEIKTSGNISIWERDMELSQQCLAFIMNLLLKKRRDSTLSGPLWEQQNHQDELNILKKIELQKYICTIKFI